MFRKNSAPPYLYLDIFGLEINISIKINLYSFYVDPSVVFNVFISKIEFFCAEKFCNFSHFLIFSVWKRRKYAIISRNRHYFIVTKIEFNVMLVTDGPVRNILTAEKRTLRRQISHFNNWINWSEECKCQFWTKIRLCHDLIERYMTVKKLWQSLAQFGKMTFISRLRLTMQRSVI